MTLFCNVGYAKKCMDELSYPAHRSIRNSKVAIFVVVLFLIFLTGVVIISSNQLTKSDSSIASNPYAAEPSTSATTLQPGNSMRLECLGSKIISLLSNGDKTMLVQCLANTPTPSQSGGLEFEAESGTITAPFQTTGGYVFQTTRNTDGIAGGGEAHYTVNIPQTGQYVVQGLVCAPSIDENSLFLKFDSHPSSREYWVVTPTGSGCNWQTANWRLNGQAEVPAQNPVTFNLTQGIHTLHVHGREQNTRIDKWRVTLASSVTGTQPTITSGPGQPTRVPTNGPQPTSGPAPTHQQPNPTSPPPQGTFPGGVYPNAAPGWIPVSYQGWSVSAADLGGQNTRDFVYGSNFHKLAHWHFDYNLPNTCGNKVSINSDTQMPVTLTTYNDNSPINMCRAQNQGSTYQEHKINLPPCQAGTGVNGEGKECVTKDKCIFTLRANDFKGSTELRLTPNSSKSPAAGGNRWYLSTNFQTKAGYRKSCQLFARDENCGTYHRTIISNYDKLFASGEPIPTVRGTVPIELEFNGGCGSFSRSLVFADPNQHVGTHGTITGTVLMDTPNDFKGTFNLNTTQLSNGIHKILMINIEGSNNLVGASGIALLFNVQN